MNIKNQFLILISFLFIGCGTIVKTFIPLNSLPIPSGKYTIGTVQYHWKDNSRAEWFSEKDPNDFRELMVQIWYPSDENPTFPPNPYMDNLGLRIPEFSKQIGLPQFMINHITEISTHSYQDIKISGKKEFPVIIFSHGLGGMRVQNTAYVEELVSHGFVVIAMDHTFDANITIFPNGEIKNYNSNLPEDIKDEKEAFQIRYKQLDTRTKDVTFVLNKMEKLNNNPSHSFFNKLKLDNVGIFGHSFGGATSVSALFNDSRITSGLSLDGWFEILPQEILNNGLKHPFFHLGQVKWKEPLNYKNRDTLIANSTSSNWISTFLGSRHFDYMDLPLFTNKTRSFKLSGEINPIEFFNCLNEIQLSFFNHNVKNIGEFNPELIAKKHPFMIIEQANSSKELSIIE